MRLSRKMGAHKSGAVIPPEPTSWVWQSTYISADTFIAPQDNWYRIHAIGHGGKGGNGGTGASSGSYYGAGGGGGGGSGQYSVSAVFLRMGDTISLSVTDSLTTAICEQATISSLAGEDGARGGDATTSSLGSGGSGGGGSSDGLPGDSGMRELSYGFYAGGDGGGGGMALASALYMGSAQNNSRATGGEGAWYEQGYGSGAAATGASATGVSTGSNVVLGRGGAGGGGGSRNNRNGAPGGAGFTGGVVIERGA